MQILEDRHNKDSIFKNKFYFHDSCLASIKTVWIFVPKLN